MAVVWALEGVVSYVDGSWAGFDVREDDQVGFTQTGPNVSDNEQIVKLMLDLGLPTKPFVPNPEVADIVYRFSILDAASDGDVIEVGASNGFIVKDEKYAQSIALVGSSYTFINHFSGNLDYPFNGTYYLQKDTFNWGTADNYPRSMFGWVKPADKSGGPWGLFGLGDVDTDLLLDHSILVYNAELKKEVSFYGREVAQQITQALEPEKWNFIGMSYDGETDTLNVFVNRKTYTISVPALATTGTTFRIGLGMGMYGFLGNAFVGDMACVSYHAVYRSPEYADKLRKAGRINLYDLPFDLNYILVPSLFDVLVDEFAEVTPLMVKGAGDAEEQQLEVATKVYTGPISYYFGNDGSDERDANNLDLVPVQADFTYSGEIAGEPVIFTNTSTVKAHSYFWDFGDGSTSTEENPSHTYIFGDTYTVTLTVDGSLKKIASIRIFAFLLDEPMDGASLQGTLKSDAYYDIGGEYVRLTRDVSGIYGVIEYNTSLLQGKNQFIVEFDAYYASSGAPADAIYWYMFSDNTPANARDAINGYSIYFDEWNEVVGCDYNATNVTSTGPYVLGSNAWHNIKIIYTGSPDQIAYDIIEVVVDGTLQITFPMQAHNFTGAKMGLGAWCGGNSAEHRVRNLTISY